MKARYENAYEYDKNLNIKDWIQIFNTFLMIILGFVIGIRAFIKHIYNPILILVVIGFIGLGLMRMKYVFIYFKNKRRNMK